MADSLDVTFNGNDAAECTHFIRAVKRYAKASGKVRDYAWIADQVSDAFDGRALHWYLKQPQNVQEDWVLLQTALITKWPLDGNDANERQTSNIPSLAPAAQAPENSPSRPPSTSNKHAMDGKIGRLRVRGPWNRRSEKFLSRILWTGSTYLHMRGSLMITSNEADAQTVKLNEVESGVWRMGFENHPSSRLYIAALASEGPYGKSYGTLVGVDVPHGKPIRDHHTTYWGIYPKAEFWTDVWKLENGRYLTLSGPPGALGQYTVPLVVRPPDTEGLLWFCAPHKNDSDEQKEVEFEFEPMVA